MRRLAWLLALFGLLGAPALADVSVGNGSIGVPLVCAQGGTGQTSYTTGDILYASASCTISKLAAVASGSVLASAGVGAAPVWTSAPAFSGANITAGSIPDSALSSDVPAQTCTTWTPSDQSGASLTFTLNGNQYYCKTGKQAIVQFDVTYPLTASSALATISSPVTCQSVNFGGGLSYNTSALSAGIRLNGNTIIFPAVPNTGGGGYANNALSTFRLAGTAACQTTS